MREAAFVAAHEAAWNSMEMLLSRPKAQRSAADLRAFPHQYRALCEQKAIAEQAGFSPALLARLNQLAVSGYQLLYHDHAHTPTLIGDYFLFRLPQAVRKNWPYFAVAVALFVLPMLAGLAMLHFAPDLVADTGAPFEAMYRPLEGAKVGESRGADSDVLMWGHYLMNNTSIGLRTIVGGVLFGFGVVASLVYNGWFFGLVSADMLRVGYAWQTFFPFVVTHAAFEMTAIVFSGATGLALARALFFPGRRRRGDAVRLALQQFFPILVATVLLFFIAAWVEAFWSARAHPAGLKLTVGALAWAMVFAYFIFVGRRRG